MIYQKTKLIPAHDSYERAGNRHMIVTLKVYRHMIFVKGCDENKEFTKKEAFLLLHVLVLPHPPATTHRHDKFIA